MLPGVKKRTLIKEEKYDYDWSELTDYIVNNRNHYLILIKIFVRDIY